MAVEPVGAVAHRDEQRRVVGAHIAAVARRVDAAQFSRELVVPKDRPVEGVLPPDAVVALHVEKTVAGERRRVAPLPVDHAARARFAEPLQSHFAAVDDLVAAVSRLRGAAVGVRPLARVVEWLALGQEEIADGLGGRPPCQRRAGDELGQAALRKATQREHAAAWPQNAQQLRAVARQRAGVQQLARHGEVVQVAGVPKLGQGPVLNDHARAVNAGSPQRRARARRLASISGHADHGQLGALGQRERQPPFAAAVVDRVAFADAGGRDDRLGGGSAFMHPLILRVRRLDASDVRPRIIKVRLGGRRLEPLGLSVLLDADRVMINYSGFDTGDNGLVLPCPPRQVDAVLQRRRRAVREARRHRLGGFPADDRLARRGKREVRPGAQLAVGEDDRRLGPGGVLALGSVVAVANLLARERAIVKAHLGDEAFQRIKLVVVEVTADHERRWRVVDLSLALAAVAALGAVDVNAHPRAVVSADDVIPASGLKRDGGVHVSEVAAGGQREVELVVVVAEHPAFLETAVVLQAADDAAPLGGRVHGDPRLGGELARRQRLGLVLAGQLDVIIRPVEVQRRRVFRWHHPPVQQAVLVAGNIFHRRDVDVLRREHPLIHRALSNPGNTPKQKRGRDNRYARQNFSAVIHVRDSRR